MRGVLAEDAGTPKMKEIAEAIQEGAIAYLKRQFRTIGFILIPLAVVVFVTSIADRRSRTATECADARRSPGLFRTLAFIARLLHVGPHRLHRHEPRGARQRAHRGRGHDGLDARRP